MSILNDPIVFPPWLAARRSRDSTSPHAKVASSEGTTRARVRCYGSPKRHVIPVPWESTRVMPTLAGPMPPSLPSSHLPKMAPSLGSPSAVQRMVPCDVLQWTPRVFVTLSPKLPPLPNSHLPLSRALRIRLWQSRHCTQEQATTLSSPIVRPTSHPSSSVALVATSTSLGWTRRPSPCPRKLQKSNLSLP